MRTGQMAPWCRVLDTVLTVPNMQSCRGLWTKICWSFWRWLQCEGGTVCAGGVAACCCCLLSEENIGTISHQQHQSRAPPVQPAAIIKMEHIRSLKHIKVLTEQDPWGASLYFRYVYWFCTNTLGTLLCSVSSLKFASFLYLIFDRSVAF